MFESGSDEQPEDNEAIEAAYGYRLGEIVMYRGLVQGKIIEFGHEYDVTLLLWNPDKNEYTGMPTRVSINECE